MSIQMQYIQEFQINFPQQLWLNLSTIDAFYTYLYITNFLLYINISFHLNLYLS